MVFKAVPYIPSFKISRVCHQAYLPPTFLYISTTEAQEISAQSYMAKNDVLN